jgi:hypothetical protein
LAREKKAASAALVRCRAEHYPDVNIAGILNRQERAIAYAHRFIGNLFGNLRRHRGIACFGRPSERMFGGLLSVAQT